MKSESGGANSETEKDISNVNQEMKKEEVSMTESENSRQSELAQAPSDTSALEKNSSSKEKVHRRPVKKFVEQKNKQT